MVMKLKVGKLSMLQPQAGKHLFLIFKRVYIIIKGA